MTTKEEILAQAVPDRDKLVDLINEHFGDAYFCTRVWNAWNVGTMSQDDFVSVSECDNPHDLADAIIAMLVTQSPEGEKE